MGTIHSIIADAIAEMQEATDDPDVLAGHVLTQLQAHDVAVVAEGDEVGVVRIGFPDSP